MTGADIENALREFGGCGTAREIAARLGGADIKQVHALIRTLSKRGVLTRRGKKVCLAR
jgi:DNA-binding MarR family transcriptional regulator